MLWKQSLGGSDSQSYGGWKLLKKGDTFSQTHQEQAKYEHRQKLLSTLKKVGILKLEKIYTANSLIILQSIIIFEHLSSLFIVLENKLFKFFLVQKPQY